MVMIFRPLAAAQEPHKHLLCLGCGKTLQRGERCGLMAYVGDVDFCYDCTQLALREVFGEQGDSQAVSIGCKESRNVGQDKQTHTTNNISPPLAPQSSFVPKIVWLNASFKSLTVSQAESLLIGKWYWDLYRSVNNIDYWRRAIYIRRNGKRRRVTVYHGRRY